MNLHRYEHDLDPLKLIPILSDIALQHSYFMANMFQAGEPGYLNHIGFGDRISYAATLGYSMVGENCASAQTMWYGADQIVQMWIDSPGHHAAIVNPAANKVGVGSWLDGVNGLFTVVFVE
jgi:uncharacterized protein YkwD